MATRPLEILKKGLAKFSKTIKDRKEDLNAKLQRKESISSADERWLDHEANTIDEQCVIEKLEAASDYERGFGKLDEASKAVVKKLKEWAGELVQAAGNKRKRAYAVCMPAKPTDILTEGSEFEKQNREPKKKPVKPSIPTFTKKENASLEQRIEILDWYHKNGKSQTATAKHFAPKYPNLKIKQLLISSWLKDEEMWRMKWQQTNGASDRKAKQARQTEHPEVSEMMYLWVSKAMGDSILLTGEILRQKWNAFADLVGVAEDERLKLSNGWLGRFKERNGLKEMRRHGEAASSRAETVEKERKRIQELKKKYGYELRDIFNMDETGLFYGYAPFIHSLSSPLILTSSMAPDRGLSDCKRPGVKGKKVRLTYAFTSNADGSEKLRPFVIGKAARPRAFNKKTGEQLGFYYRNNAKAWMTAHLYQDWMSEKSQLAYESLQPLMNP